jgi:osmoprotectant transport system ATP-binding protein
LIELHGVTKKYGENYAIKDVTFNVKEGETLVLLGLSGSGKSTTLRTINRIVEPDSGDIYVDGKNSKDFKVEDLRKQMGYVIQSIGLFPHMTVEENIGLVPGSLGWSRAKIKERVKELLELVGLEPEVYAKRFPRELSGGEAQRVGVARALAADPPILLMDEPFGALDPITRKNLQHEFLKLKSKVKKTIVFVTHDIYEAVVLADRIALMNNGTVEQVGTPVELLLQPKTDFVRRFLGSDFPIHILSRFKVLDVIEEVENPSRNGEAKISMNSSLKEALSEMLKLCAERLSVVDEEGRVVGVFSFKNIVNFIGKV